MNEKKLAPMIAISCIVIIIVIVLIYDNKQQDEIQHILESEEVSELEYPATLYQLPINKKVEDVVPVPVVKEVPVMAAIAPDKKENDDHVVSSPLPKKEAIKSEHSKEKPKYQAAKGRYHIQIGAYKKLSGAKKRAAELTKAKWSVQIVRRKGLHLIWIGPLNTREQAKKIQRKLLKNRFIKGFIVKR